MQKLNYNVQFLKSLQVHIVPFSIKKFSLKKFALNIFQKYKILVTYTNRKIIWKCLKGYCGMN